MTKVITVAMGKGGVGKSLLAFHLIHAAAETGVKVLALDLDRQGSLLHLLEVQPAQHLAGVLAGFVPFGPQMLAEVVGAPGVRVLPGDGALVQAEAALLLGGKQPDYLRRLLPSFGYGDLAVLDTGTSGYLSEMALAAADVVVAPVAMRSADADMLPPFLDRVAAINPQARVLVVPNRYDRRTKVSEEVYGRVLQAAKTRWVTFSPILPETVELDAARLDGCPVWRKRPQPASAEAMNAVATAALSLAGVLVPA